MAYDDSDQVDTAMDDDSDQSLGGTLSNLSNALTQMVNPSTTKEAQQLSREFIEDYRKGDPALTSAQEDIHKNAEETRRILREARERIAARRYDKRNLWLAAAAGFGSPTNTGAFGETAANVAKAVLPYREKEQAFAAQQGDELSQYDQALGAVNDRELGNRLQILMANQKSRAEMAKEALKNLGKPLQTGKNSSQNSLDRAYSKEYVDFIQGGSADAQRALDELNQARNSLKGLDATGNPTPSGKPESITGPVVGSLSTLPFIGKPIQDIFFPKSANTQEMVESTVQRSLRPILGAQFTEKEGERLISRVYNPRLDESINAQRLDRLINQLQRAFDQKKAAAAYYEQNGTLMGFHGKVSWKTDDFMPDDSWPGGATYHPTATPAEAAQPGQGGDGFTQFEDIQSGKVKRKRKFRWPWQLAKGGEVEGSGERKIVKMPDGVPVEVDASIPDQDVIDQYMASGGIDVPTTALESATAGGLGYLATKYGVRGAMRASDLLPGRGINPGEKRVLNLMDWSDTDPTDLASRLRSLQRKQVPANLLDVSSPAVRGLAEASMLPRAEATQPFVSELQARQKGARGRVADQINDALAPDAYQALVNKLTKDRLRRSQPLYEAAFDQFPTVKSPELISLMETDSGKKAIRNALKTFKDQPGVQPFGPPDALGMSRSFSLQFLDQVKREFDDMIGKARSTGQMDKARRLGALRDQLRNAVDAATSDPQGNSPYKTARNQYEQDSKLLEAAQYGHDEFLKASPEEAADYVKNLDFTGRDVLRSGVAESLLRNLQGPTTEGNPAQKIIGSPDLMSKMELLFDKPKDFQLFKEALEAEKDMFDETRGTLSKGKQATGTYEAPDSVIHKFVKENAPALGVLSPTYWVLKNARKNSQIGEKEANQILSILKTRDPKYIESTLGSKFRRAQKRKALSGKVGLVGAALSAAAPWIRQPDDEEAPDESAVPPTSQDVTDEDLQNPVFKGLTPEQIRASKKPAYGKGGDVKKLTSLFTKDGKLVNVGDKVNNFRGEEHTVQGWYSKPPPSSGRVVTDKGEYYPSVFDLQLAQPGHPILVKKRKGGLVSLKRKYLRA